MWGGVPGLGLPELWLGFDFGLGAPIERQTNMGVLYCLGLV